MKKRIIVGAVLATCVGCGTTVPPLFSGIGLIGAIARAPAGQRACTAFSMVLNRQADGRSLSDLLNAGLQVNGSSVQFTSEEGDAILQMAKYVNCDFISCLVEQIKAQNPPADDASAVAWAMERLGLLANIATGCPSATILADDQKVQLVRLIVALQL